MGVMKLIQFVSCTENAIFNEMLRQIHKQIYHTNFQNEVIKNKSLEIQDG